MWLLGACGQGSAPGFVSIVAHEDDDLLFVSPDLDAAITAAAQVLTVFVTAGDDGQADAYWQGREAGIRAAYAFAAGVDDAWDEDVAAAGAGAVAVHRATLRGHRNVRLAFLRLPDGGLDGAGFAARGHESLRQLWHGALPALHPVDGGAAVSREALVDALGQLIASGVRPHTEDRLHVLNCAPTAHAFDHPDHRISALFALAAHARGPVPVPMVLHWGYEVRNAPANVDAATADRKQRVFLAYAAHDPGIVGVSPGPRPGTDTGAGHGSQTGGPGPLQGAGPSRARSTRSRRPGLAAYLSMARRAYAWRPERDAVTLTGEICAAPNAPRRPLTTFPLDPTPAAGSFEGGGLRF